MSRFYKRQQNCSQSVKESSFDNTQSMGSMFNVEIPSSSDQKTGGKNPSSLKFNLQLGKIRDDAKKIVASGNILSIKFSACILVINKIFDIMLNSFTLVFIFLAVCTSVYSQLVQYSLQQSTELYDTRTDAIPYVVAAIQEHCIGGLNATSWNLVKSASVSLESLSESYADAQTVICSLLNSTAVSSSRTGKRNLLSNGTDSLKMADPKKWDLAHCNSLFAQQTHLSTYGQSNVTLLAQSMDRNLSHLMDIQIPVIDTSSLDHVNGDIIASIRRTGKAWIAVFSVMATFSIALSIFWSFVPYREVDDQQLQRPYRPDGAVRASLISNCFEYVASTTGCIYRYVRQLTLKGHINRLLAISLVLILFSISNCTVLNKAHAIQSYGDASTTLERLNSTTVAYAQYEEMFNNKALQLIGKFIGDLNENHILAEQKFCTQYEFNLTSSIPFPYGVAVSIISLPLVDSRQLPSAILTSGSKSDAPSHMLHILRNIATGSWISAIILLCVWLASNIAAYVFV